MFDTLIVQPISNVLVLIYGLLPGHNFGLALIIFTIVVRLLMWPLIKKQLHHAKAMRALQPELKRIKKEAKGDRQKEQLLTMALYKSKEINPFASIGILLVQLPILIGLYSGLSRILKDPQQLVDFAYPFLRDLPGMKELAANVSSFDSTLFGAIDLHRAALTSGGGIYVPAMIIVIAGTVAQYFQSKQLMVTDKNARTLRQVLKEASAKGEQPDSSEVNAAMGRSTRYIFPVLIFFVTVNIPAALSLYFLVGGLVAYAQQWYILRQDETELEAIADAPSSSKVIEGEIIQKKSTPKTKKGGNKKRKRR